MTNCNPDSSDMKPESADMLELSGEPKTANPGPKRTKIDLWKERMVKWFFITLVIWIAVQFLVIVGAVSVLQWNLMQGDKVMSIAPAGIVVRVTSMDSFWGGSQVETDRGYFFVRTPASIYKQEPLNLEYRGDHSRWLCDSAHTCSKLSSFFD